MLPIKLHTTPSSNFTNYEDAITYLASHTVAIHRGEPLRPLGRDKPSFDISQVCCWVSEQPMIHGMRLCTLNNGSEKISIISEPIGEDAMQTEDNIAIPIHKGIKAKDLLLISEDTYAGLKMSLEYFAKEGAKQTLIKDPKYPSKNVTDPWNYKHYIWPTKAHKSDGIVYELEVLAVNPGDYYNAQSCFVYTPKTAVVKQISEHEEVLSAASEEHLFIEADLALPAPLYVMAQNTIRLFRLNGRYYEHENKDHHSLVLGRRIQTLEVDEEEPYYETRYEGYYDDLRLAGRMEAWKRARKSLNQLKNLDSLLSDKETTDILINQYKILTELSGYRSVWATVFNDGGEPGSFNDILGVPAPVAPLEPLDAMDIDNTDTKKRKRELLDINNNQLIEVEIKEHLNENGIKIPENAFINMEELANAIAQVLNNPDLWEQLITNKIEKIKSEQLVTVLNNLMKAVTFAPTLPPSKKQTIIDEFGKQNSLITVR